MQDRARFRAHRPVGRIGPVDLRDGIGEGGCDESRVDSGIRVEHLGRD
ncbi:MAG: hypothetical protein BWY91_02076 [bacterium ADurb.BinA028]|nr:MAG: hypothetical protein BWY91_02076 [bacterium ADurb.BinA028]